MKHARPDYNRIQDPAGLIPADEPVFLLRGQDVHAASTVRFYALLVESARGDALAVRLSREHAAAMEAWPVHKEPDIPEDAAAATGEPAGYTDIVVRRHDDGGLEVLLGERTMGRATWGEVLEQVTALTHPLIDRKREQYPMQTPQEWERRQRARYEGREEAAKPHYARIPPEDVAARLAARAEQTEESSNG